MSSESPQPSLRPGSNADVLRRTASWIAVIGIVAAIGWWGYRYISFDPKADLQLRREEARRRAEVAERERFAIPEIERAPFRNASTSVAYVGSRACLECHPNEHGSYLETTHSRSLAAV